MYIVPSCTNKISLKLLFLALFNNRFHIKFYNDVEKLKIIKIIID